MSKESGKKKKRKSLDWADKHAAGDKRSYDKQHEFEEERDFEMVSSNHIKLLSKIRLHGSGDDNEVNKSEEFDGKHFRWEFLFH